MTGIDFDRLRGLVVDALEVPAHARERFLRERCDDEALFEAARRLLRHDSGKVLELGDDEPPSREDPERIGRYPVSRRIAAGGMGVVYLATDPALDREVAIKRLPDWLAQEPEALERFREEARHLAQMNHPNIATLYSLEADGERTFLTMELITGEPLAAALSRGPLDLDRMLPILRGVAGALEAAHAKGIAHRDLKPHNIMVTDSGEAKVLDFGLAVRIGEGGKGRQAAIADPAPSDLRDGERSPRSWTAAGTPGYMSPERIRGEAEDAAADVWSFGCVLFECLAGVRAFGGSREERLRATLHDPAPLEALPGSTPAQLRRLIEECFVKEPAQRLASMREARRVIEGVIERRERDRLRGIEPRANAASSLPRYLSRFLGREPELGEIARRLREGRLVTLVGLGGCGKTRLAVEALSRAGGDAVWVDLVAVENPGHVAVAILSALNVTAPEKEPLDQLTRILSDSDRTLLLDNCEHLLATCRELLQRLLAQCQALRVLATSREPLGIEGEAVVPVAPLPVPETGPVLQDNPAVALFLDRARILNPALDLSGSTGATAAEICRRVEGIPLALEIAASHLDVLSLGELRARLEQRLELSQESRTTRHHSLRAVVESSFQRLNGLEQAMLQRMAVFPGSWTLEAAEAVGLSGGEAPWRAFELVKSLARKSLMQRVQSGDAEAPSRFRMLETVADFARGRLRAAGEEPSACRAMVRFHGEMFAEGGGRGVERWRLARKFRSEEDNVAAAIDAAAAHCALEEYARLVAGVAPLMWHCGRYQEGLRRCREAVASLDRAGEGGHPVAGELLAVEAGICVRAGDLEESTAAARRAHEIAVALGRLDIQADALNTLGNVERRRDRLPEAIECFERALAAARTVEDARRVASIRFNRGVVFLHMEGPAAAEPEFRASLESRERLGDESEISECINALGVVAALQGRYEQARARYEEGLAMKRRTEHLPGVVTSLVNLSRVTINLVRSTEQDRGLLVESRAFSDEGIALAKQIGDRMSLATLYLSRASVESLDGNAQAAVAAGELGVRAAREVGSVRYEASGFDVLGKIALEQGDFELAAAHGETALTLFLKAEPVSAYHALRTIARARFGLGDARAALALLVAARVAAARASAKQAERDEATAAELEAAIAAGLDAEAAREAVRLGETTTPERILEELKRTAG